MSDDKFIISECGLKNLFKHLKKNRFSRNKERWRAKGVRKEEVKTK